MNELMRTPLYECHKNLNAKIVDFAGWEMPIQYVGINEEHKTVRTGVGIFDVSHMGEVLVEGDDATKYVQNLITNDVNILVDFQVLYAMMCYEHGGIVDDLLVYKYNNKKYLLVINASNIDKDFKWMKKQINDYKVEITNLSNSFGEIAIQGPKAQEVLQQIVDVDLDSIKFFHFFDKIKIKNINCIISRTGYTGEDGFEVYVDKNDTEYIWDTLIKLGSKPIGLGARDTLRFEANLPLYGNELSKDITPLEAGLGYFVKLDTDFIGKKALLKQKEEGLTRKIVGFKLLGKGIPRHGYKVFNDEQKEIGFVTTGYIIPNYENPIGLALIDINHNKLGSKIYIQIRKKIIEAEVVSKKFMNKKYKK